MTQAENEPINKKPISPNNQAAIKALDEWMATPDDMGEEWWNEFEAFLKANRFTLRRNK